MPTVRPHGKKFRLEFRLNGKRRNVPIPSQLPESFHELIHQHADRLIERMCQNRQGEFDRAYLERELIALHEQHQKENQHLRPFSEIGAGWLSQLTLRPNTIAGYRRTFQHLRRFFGSSPVSEIRASLTHTQQYVEKRKADGASRQTIIRELTTLNLILAYCGLSPIPRKQLRLPTEKGLRHFGSINDSMNGRQVVLTDSEVEELIAIVSQRGSQLISDAVLFVAYTGARRGEVTRLRASHVDLERMRVVLTSYKKEKGVDSPTVIPIHERLRPMLERRKKSDVIFTRSTHTLAAGLKQAIRGTKFDKKGFGFHALRHSLASRLIQRQTPITAVSCILGHSRISTTLDIYSHAMLQDIQNAIETL